MTADRKKVFLITLAAFFAGIGVFHILFFILGIQLLILCLLKDKRKIAVLIALGYAVSLILAVAASLIQFDFMPQARELLNYNTNVIYWFMQGHIHAIRLLIAYPGYLLSEAYHIPLDKGYSYYVIAVFCLTFIIICNLSAIRNTRSIASMITLGSVFLALSFVMNGRIIFAFLGYSILINTAFEQSQHQRFITRSEIFLYSTGIFFTTVSSGCMLIGFTFTAVCLFIKWFYIESASRKQNILFLFLMAAVLCFPVLSKVLAYVAFMINKNITFYGGGLTGVIGMLQHGLGRVLPELTTEFYPFLFTLGGIAVLLNILLVKHLFIQTFSFTAIIAVAFNLSCYGLLVGFSTGSMGMIPFFIVSGMKLNCLKVAGK